MHASTLFILEIKNKSDIIVLENKIRELLQCESYLGCSFIQSAPYKRMITTLLLQLNGIISFDEEIRLYFGSNSMILVMRNDLKTIEILKKDVHLLCYDDCGEDRKRKIPRRSKEESFVAKIMHKRTHQHENTTMTLK